MHDSKLTKVNEADLKEALGEISKLQENKELSKASLIQRQFKFYFQTRKELRDSCCFVNVHIQSGRYNFTKKLELKIDNLLYYIRDGQLCVCTFNEETMTIEKQYNSYSRYAHPLLLKKWYDHLNRRHYFDSMKSFLAFYKFDKAID